MTRLAHIATAGRSLGPRLLLVGDGVSREEDLPPHRIQQYTRRVRLVG